MPFLYDYTCEFCGLTEEHRLNYRERDTVFTCPNCEGDLVRESVAHDPGGFVLKGAGWAADGYGPSKKDPVGGSEGGGK